MKTHQLFFLFITLSVLLCGTTACNDDEFLKEKAETSYTFDNMFDSSTQISNLLAEMYFQHRSVYTASNLFMYGIGTDAFDRRPNGVLVSDFADWSTTYGATRDVFNVLYTLIAKANLVIYGAEQVDWSNESAKANVVAQARFMRGYAYMILGELWGGVPINEEFSEAPKFNFTRTSREDTYLFAIDEMEAAVNALPDRPQSGRVGKGAVNHFLAECYIALATIKGNDAALLDRAITAADAVISQHPLMKERFGSRADPASTNVYNGIAAYTPDGNVYYDLFPTGNPNNPINTEALWLFHNNGALFQEYGSGGGVSLGMSQFSPNIRDALWRPEFIQSDIDGPGPWIGSSVPDCPWGTPNVTVAILGGMGYGNCIPTNMLRTTVWEQSGEGDIRNDSINIRRNIPVLNQGRTQFPAYLEIINVDKAEQFITAATLYMCYPIFQKIAPSDDWAWECLNYGYRREFITWDYYIARSAETYLLRAEAKLRKGDLQGAAVDINEVRGRSHAKLIEATDVTIDYILNERLRELFIEERRWCTLLRIGGKIPNDRITNYSKAADYQGGDVLWTHMAIPLADDFLWPIPQTVIDSNLDAEIEQNPMWK